MLKCPRRSRLSRRDGLAGLEVEDFVADFDRAGIECVARAVRRARALRRAELASAGAGAARVRGTGAVVAPERTHRRWPRETACASSLVGPGSFAASPRTALADGHFAAAITHAPNDCTTASEPRSRRTRFRCRRVSDFASIAHVLRIRISFPVESAIIRHSAIASGASRLLRIHAAESPASYAGSRMRVLVSNDDGVDAPGIGVLARHLAAVGEVIVVAPDRDRSGASNSLTLDQPIRVMRTRGRIAIASPARQPIACIWRLSGSARSRTRHRRFRHQQRGQSRRRRHLFGHRFGGDGRAFPRPAGDRGFAGHASTTRASITTPPPRP